MAGRTTSVPNVTYDSWMLCCVFVTDTLAPTPPQRCSIPLDSSTLVQVPLYGGIVNRAQIQTVEGYLPPQA